MRLHVSTIYKMSLVTLFLAPLDDVVLWMKIPLFLISCVYVWISTRREFTPSDNDLLCSHAPLKTHQTSRSNGAEIILERLRNISEMRGMESGVVIFYIGVPHSKDLRTTKPTIKRESHPIYRQQTMLRAANEIRYFRRFHPNVWEIKSSENFSFQFYTQGVA